MDCFHSDANELHLLRCATRTRRCVNIHISDTDPLVLIYVFNFYTYCGPPQ